MFILTQDRGDNSLVMAFSSEELALQYVKDEVLYFDGHSNLTITRDNNDVYVEFDDGLDSNPYRISEREFDESFTK